MIASTFSTSAALGHGLHVALIMDGNGRWASARGRPRVFGHRAGAAAVRRVVEAAVDHGVATLSLYAFSSDNWRRPAAEVDSLMGLMARYLCEESSRCLEHGVALEVMGRRDRLPAPLLEAIDEAERTTVGGRGLRLRIAVDYSARDSILRAAGRARGVRGLGREAFQRLLAQVSAGAAGAAPVPDVDLLIRTGGERRLSDFLLWECAYAELYFTDCAWPDFGERQLTEALTDYRARTRRFGGLEVVR